LHTFLIADSGPATWAVEKWFLKAADDAVLDEELVPAGGLRLVRAGAARPGARRPAPFAVPDIDRRRL
jgi:hypothetical protein